MLNGRSQISFSSVSSSPAPVVLTAKEDSLTSNPGEVEGVCTFILKREEESFS